MTTGSARTTASPDVDTLAMAPEPTELSPGLWRWATRHPEWHPGWRDEGTEDAASAATSTPAASTFGREVACYALVDDDDRLLLVDPLLPEAEEQALRADQGEVPRSRAMTEAVAVPTPVLDWLDGLATPREVLILITLGYHVRSAEPLHRRYACAVWGPAEAGSRLDDPGLLSVYSPDEPGPAGVTAFAFGSPPRGERALYLPSHRAVAFGDIVVSTPSPAQEADPPAAPGEAPRGGGGELRLWEQGDGSERRARWYADRFVPTFAPLLEHSIDRVLVTHGEPVLEHGGEALRAALAARPWVRPG